MGRRENFDDLELISKEQNWLGRSLVHLRQRRKDNRIGLVLGAGITHEAGCPLWSSLVNKLAKALPKSAGIKRGAKSAKLEAPYLTEVIYRRFLNSDFEKSSGNPNYIHIANSRWITQIRKALYEKVSDSKIRAHPYLDKLAQLARSCQLVVTFNFDDILDEKMSELAEKNREQVPTVRYCLPESLRQAATTIYHINGVLPRIKGRKRSEELVFTEDAFAKILMNSDVLKSEYLISQFSERTFLLIGLSLTDASLRSLLRASKERNPANHHYMIVHCGPNDHPSHEEKRDIFTVNLEVYNVITIFLSSTGIASTLEKINSDDDGKFGLFVTKLGGFSAYKYYVVGAIGTGKTTLIEHLRCFMTVEEWTGRVPEYMYEDHAKLTSEQRKLIDDWLWSQFKNKDSIFKALNSGIGVMDRGPLDLFAFSLSSDENLKKIDSIRTRIFPGGETFDNGQIIFLEASDETLETRQIRRGRLDGEASSRNYSAKALSEQSKALQLIYAPNLRFNTSLDSPTQLAQKVARLILLGEYNYVDFSARINEISNNSGSISLETRSKKRRKRRTVLARER